MITYQSNPLPSSRQEAIPVDPTVDQVFGIRTEPVLSYVNREDVDGRFAVATNSHHHIVVYGSSKQGKTSLRQTHLDESGCIIVRCGPTMTVESIYSSVLRQAHIRIETFTTSTEGVSGGVKTKLGFKAMIPFLGSGSTEVEASGTAQSQEVLHTEFVGFDFGEAQSIGELLQAAHFDQFVILENFHYLAEEVQQQLAYDLKTFHEINVRFVILGIWREADFLITYNHDLQDRLIDIPVEPWAASDFRRVVAKGCRLLDISISENAVDRFVKDAYGNVGMFQEFLRTFCQLSDVQEKQQHTKTLDDTNIVERTIEHRLQNQRAQLLKDLQRIGAQCRIRREEQDPLLLPYYLARVIATVRVDELQEGIERNRLLELLRQIHHRNDKSTVRMSDLIYLLTRLPHYQKDMQPPLVYYDSNSKRLKLVDTRQFFVLANVNGDELAEEIPFPLEYQGDMAG